MYDRVVTINNTHWPGYRKPGATLVDLRMFDPNDRSVKPRLVFRPDKLRELGIPAALIEAAAKSDPQGFLLFDDLPNSAGASNRPGHNLRFRNLNLEVRDARGDAKLSELETDNVLRP